MGRKLFLTLTLLILFGCNFLEDHDGWKKLGSIDEFKYYIKTSSISKKDNISSALIKFEYESLKKFSKYDTNREELLKDMKGYKSAISLTEIDCSRYKITFKEERLFSEDGYEVFVRKRSRGSNVKPGSVGENIYDALCQ